MKKFSLYILTGIVLLLSYACEKQLSEPPKNEKVDGTAIIDQATAQIGLNGVYFMLANVDRSANITGWTSHGVYPDYLAGYLGYGYGQTPEENSVMTGGYDQCWMESYSCINTANGVIKSVTALPDEKFTGSRKKEILGEARFIRAYNHFRILTYFGEWWNTGSKLGALLRDELSTLSNILKARSNVADSYKFILEDLDYAIANAPATNTAYYATKWAAMALKMKVLMNRGAQGDYATVITLADNIITNSPYTLEANVKDIFYSKGLNSKEVILGIKPQANQETYYYVLSRQYASGASSLYVAKKALKDITAIDPRGNWLVGPANPYAFYGSIDTYYFTKFIAALAAPTQLSETSYVLRLSEVYLLKSEAIIRSGGILADARTLLKNIQGHAGVTDFSPIDNATTADQLLLQNYYETVRSLVGEDGADWMALLRLPLAQVKLIKPTINGTVQFIFPVPHSEFLSNPLFGDQNPGYPK
jgi:starch-binding outer membrane protein, SusD/RagB family